MSRWDFWDPSVSNVTFQNGNWFLVSGEWLAFDHSQHPSNFFFWGCPTHLSQQKSGRLTGPWKRVMADEKLTLNCPAHTNILILFLSLWTLCAFCIIFYTFADGISLWMYFSHVFYHFKPLWVLFLFHVQWWPWRPDALSHGRTQPGTHKLLLSTSTQTLEQLTPS